VKAPFSYKKDTLFLAAGLAVLAAALLVVFVILVRWQALELVESQIRAQAVNVTEALRDKLEGDLRRAGTTDDPNVWARLDPEIEDHYEGIPNLLGIAIRDRAGRVIAVIGSPVAVADPVPPWSAIDDLGVALHPREGRQVPVSAWFRLPRGADTSHAVMAVAHLSFDDGSALWEGFNGFVIFAACILALLIYGLAATTYLVRESRLESEARSRERFVRLRAIGEVAAGLAHEIRNPLNAIHLSVQVIERALRRGESDPRERLRAHREGGRQDSHGRRFLRALYPRRRSRGRRVRFRVPRRRAHRSRARRGGRGGRPDRRPGCPASRYRGRPREAR
jgi:signal transduction histidine kinase